MAPPTGSIMIPKNENVMEWMLDRLSKDRSRKAKNLALYQSVPLYYSASCVKQTGTMAAKVRDQEIAKSYKQFVASSFLKWMEQEQDHRVPEWVTLDLMGRTTFQDSGHKYYDTKKSAIYDRFQAVQRDIRKTWTPWLNKYLSNSGTQESLPSGTQHSDLLEELHDFLYSETNAGKPKPMARSEYERRIARGAALEVVSESTSPVSAGNNDSESPEERRDDADGESAGLTENVDGIEEETTVGESPATNPVLPDHRAPWEGENDPEVMVRTPMPLGWLHPNSLVFACFGKLSEAPDDDLNHSPTNGPSNSTTKRRASDGESGCDGEHENDSEDLPPSDSDPQQFGSERLSRRAINMVGSINESHSRRDVKKHRRQEYDAGQFHAGVDRILKALANPPIDVDARETASSVKVMAKAVVQSTDLQQRARHVQDRNNKIAWKKEEIATLVAMDLPEKAIVARTQLLALLHEPLSCDVPSDGGGASGGVGSGVDDGGSTGGGGDGVNVSGASGGQGDCVENTGSSARGGNGVNGGAAMGVVTYTADLAAIASTSDGCTGVDGAEEDAIEIM